METLITKIVALIENFYLATYIIAGSAVGIGVNLFGISFFCDEIWMNIGRCYFTGMIASRISSLIIEPLCTRFKIIEREPYERYLRAESEDTTGKLISMSKVSGIYCTMAAASLIVLATGVIQLIYRIEGWRDMIWNLIIGLSIFILFILSYRKQTLYVIKRIKYLNSSTPH